MGKQRKTWSPELKEQLVLAVLSGEHTIAEAAREYEVSESLIHTWRAQFLEAGRARLQGARPDAAQKKLKKEVQQLKAIIADKELSLYIAKKSGVSERR
ncbi:transposase [Deinococcus radiophilus]|uniref:transposase n=1 Tax=Deinococcus radiophilus TaxID=32062 RepID=UPI00361EB8E0